MGTNYYILKNICPTCGRSESEHIGLSAKGWSFTFQATDTIRDFEQWLANVKTAQRIIDDRNNVVTIEQILEIIEIKRKEKNSILEVAKITNFWVDYYQCFDEWVDQSGNAFIKRDFS